AARVLGQALTLAEPDGLIRVFVDEGEAMQRLLREALAGGLAPDFARQVLAAFAPAPGPARQQAPSAIVEPLSEREIEVLRHIAAGRTDRDIAERLFLSLHTVKVHARNISGKLAVGNRTHAVARARELGILALP
ncbi:MAG TPA: LuxR C-terminal-related transcriptional regulator, partial [Herpetosiphonaceae bacterium]